MESITKKLCRTPADCKSWKEYHIQWIKHKMQDGNAAAACVYPKKV